MSNKRPWSIAELTLMVDQGRAIERAYIVKTLETIAKEFTRKDELERAIAKLKKVLNERA